MCAAHFYFCCACVAHLVLLRRVIFAAGAPGGTSKPVGFTKSSIKIHKAPKH